MIDKAEDPERGRAELSRMPHDEAYWDGLVARVKNRSAPMLADYANRGSGWLGWMGDRSPALAAGALVAAALAWLLLPPAVPTTDMAASQPSAVVAALVPSDPVVARIMTDPVPPPIGDLLAISALEGGT